MERFVSQKRLDDNRHAVIKSTTERNARENGLRPHEVQKAVEIGSTLWHGQKGVGQAAKEAAQLIREGKA